MDKTKSMGTLGNNGVAPELAGKGIGTAMYQYVLDLFRQAGLKYASVGTGLDEGTRARPGAYEEGGIQYCAGKGDILPVFVGGNHLERRSWAV